jgi:sugar/nucleoside kinase (ribokinase family)
MIMSGIACAGHWVLDHLKFINNWPDRSEICTILSEAVSNGGAPFNVIVDITNLKVDIPTIGIGCIGDDQRGTQILNICHNKKININFLQILKGEKTSYTDVMTVKSTGERTMFHYKGANSRFSLEHVPIKTLKQQGFQLFYLGHLLLMDALEAVDPEYGLVATRLLHDVQQAGMETVLDIATEHNITRYQKIVVPCLPYVDHLVIDELEAQKISGIHVHTDRFSVDAVKQAAHFLLDWGVRTNVIIHLSEGAYWASKQHEDLWSPSLKIPRELMVSACGAGDAFCAGIVVGLHEGWDREHILKLAHAMAALSMTHWHNSDGIKPLNETLHITEKWL